MQAARCGCTGAASRLPHARKPYVCALPAYAVIAVAAQRGRDWARCNTEYQVGAIR